MTDLEKLRAELRANKNRHLYGYELTALLDALDAAERERDEAMGIVAVIHRDGGHRAAEVGNAQAIAEAHVKWGDLIRERDEARAKLAALESAVAKAVNSRTEYQKPLIERLEQLADQSDRLFETKRERDEVRARVAALLEVNSDLAAGNYTVVQSIKDRAP